MKYITTIYCSECLTRAYLLSTMHIDGNKISIDRDITAMAHHHQILSVGFIYRTYLTVEDCPGLGTGINLDIDTFIIQGYAT